MTAEVVIGRAHGEDAVAVAAFQTLAWRQTYRGLIDDSVLDVPVTDRMERWTERIRSGSRVVMAAWASDSIVGVASTSVDDPPIRGLPPLVLHTFYLRRDVQGTGLASRLLHAAIGDHDTHLLVFEVNERARRFYRRHGFAPEGSCLHDPGTGLAERRWVRRSHAAPGPAHPTTNAATHAG